MKTNGEAAEDVVSIDKNEVVAEPAEEALQRKITSLRWIFVMATILFSLFLFALGRSGLLNKSRFAETLVWENFKPFLTPSG
jgi:hypothetical protein